MQGYFNNPEATAAATDQGGWLRTGDIAYKEHGKYYIVDRAKVRRLSHGRYLRHVADSSHRS